MNNYQSAVFETIKQKSGGNNSYIDQIGDALNISKSAVYKRIKGDTMLSMDDLVLLMQTFEFSFDELIFDQKESIGFRFPQQKRKMNTFMDFIQPMKEFVLFSKQLPDIRVKYATNELHFFFYFHDKDLLYFKFYLFAKTIWNLKSYDGKDFSLKDFSEWVHIEQDVDLILNTYFSIPNTEIWNGDVLDNFLRQIKYVLESGLFKDPEEALYLCDRLDLILDHVNEMAKLGNKFRFGQSPDNGQVDFEMFHNEINHTSNILLMESPYHNQIFFSFDNPNYILTDEKRLVSYTIDWFERIKSDALPISTAGNKNRRAYFKSFKKHIEHTKEQIENYIRYEL